MNSKQIAKLIFNHYLKYSDNEGLHDFVTDESVYFKYRLYNTPEPSILIHDICINDVQIERELYSEVAEILDEMLFDYYIINN